MRAVELGSFSRATAEEGVKVSTVSRYITALEADLAPRCSTGRHAAYT